jgi:hypothetical protein
MSYPETNDQKREGKALRVEANNPIESTKWTFLWEFDEEERVKNQGLVDELNVINAPVQLRIVPNEYKDA